MSDNIYGGTKDFGEHVVSPATGYKTEDQIQREEILRKGTLIAIGALVGAGAVAGITTLYKRRSQQTEHILPDQTPSSEIIGDRDITERVYDN